MYLKDVAKIICTFGSLAMYRKITVSATNGDHTMSKQLWSGEAKDLINFCESDGNHDWIVDEIVDQKTNEYNADIPFYNREKIITVI